MDEHKLHNYLRKCELQYRADHATAAEELDWLTPYCGSVQEIVTYLRSIGFKIKEIIDEELYYECHRWVVTTSGVIVYVNNEYSKGLFYKRKVGSFENLD